MNSNILAGLWIPFLGTTFGAAMVFFMKSRMDYNVEKVLLGLAAGVMMAASVWSLLLPSIDMAREQGKLPWFPAAAGFLWGMAFLFLSDAVFPYFHRNVDRAKGGKYRLKGKAMLVFAVTLHNIPEGMAVGVAFAGAMLGEAGAGSGAFAGSAPGDAVTMAGALALAVGIGIQNFPEGAIISMPLCSEGVGRKKAFLYGVLSGLVEPVFGLFTILLAQKVVAALPFLLSFAAGAMIYVVVEELIPQSQTGEHRELATAGVAAGFVIMMVLDVALG